MFEVSSGLYHTASEVIREALQLLKERDDQHAALHEQIQRGLTWYIRESCPRIWTFYAAKSS
jgi:putative addiction module CopG family antidote